ncbi:MAG: OsmC family protein [Planctomycetes bacterium]|nr:OsmC family protein [Planctomycetota bacterium]
MKVEFPNAAGELLAGRLELPAGPPRAFALFAHCFTCSKDVAAASRVSRALAARGFGVLRFDFTGLGSSDGDFANTSFSSNVTDLVAAARYLREHHGPARVLVGHSLGGAAVLAAARQLDDALAVVTIGAPSEPSHVRGLFADRTCDIRRAGRAEVEIAGRRFTIAAPFLDDLDEQQLLASLPRLGKAVLVMHSPIDEVVSIEHARRIYDALTHPKSFVTLDDADHLLTRRADGEYVAEVLAAWSTRYLPPTPAEPPGAALPDHEARVSEKPGFRYAQTVEAGRHVLTADEPEHMHGTDTGPDPFGLLLGGLGACTSMTIRMYAERKGWPVEHVCVHLKHAKLKAEDCADCGERDGLVDRIERIVTIHGPLDDEQRQRLLEIANKCPVHRLLENDPVIVTRRADP